MRTAFASLFLVSLVGCSRQDVWKEYETAVHVFEMDRVRFELFEKRDREVSLSSEERERFESLFRRIQIESDRIGEIIKRLPQTRPSGKPFEPLP